MPFFHPNLITIASNAAPYALLIPWHDPGMCKLTSISFAFAAINERPPGALCQLTAKQPQPRCACGVECFTGPAPLCGASLASFTDFLPLIHHAIYSSIIGV